jgi:hypothetical protein
VKSVNKLVFIQNSSFLCCFYARPWVVVGGCKGGFMGQRRIYGAKEDLWGKGGFMGQLTLLLSICMVNQLLI